jgi:hypothetical protein
MSSIPTTEQSSPMASTSLPPTRRTTISSSYSGSWSHSAGPKTISRTCRSSAAGCIG